MPQPTPVIITISRQIGAGGRLLGQQLSHRLGWPYLDREILQLAAARVGASEASLAKWDERAVRLWERIVDSFALGPPENLYTSIPDAPTAPGHWLFELQSQVMREIAQRRSAIIIGRAACWTLAGHPGLLRIYLHASVQWRIAQLVQAQAVGTPAQARAIIDRIDSQRQSFIQEMCGGRMGEASQYDLCINRDSISLDAATDMVLRMVRQRQAQLEYPDAAPSPPTTATADQAKTHSQ